jgi:hypothetical protein
VIDFYEYFPMIVEAEAKLPPFEFGDVRKYFFARSVSGVIEKLLIDDSFKRTKGDAKVLTTLHEDGTASEYIYKGEWNKKKGVRDGKGLMVYPSGVKFEGFVHEDAINGWGRMI